MATLLNENCGCAIPVGTGWEDETVALVNALQGVLGLLPTSVGDAINDIVLLAQSGTPSTGLPYTLPFTLS